MRHGTVFKNATFPVLDMAGGPNGCKVEQNTTGRESFWICNGLRATEALRQPDVGGAISGFDVD